jgi:density-regulated protein DRP1
MERPVVLYCGVCKLPPEYCEFGKEIEKCQKWLVENAPEEVGKVWPKLVQKEEAQDTQESLESLTLNEQKETAKAPEQQQKKSQKSKQKRITVQTVERTKRKRTTVILGLDMFGAFN